MSSVYLLSTSFPVQDVRRGAFLTQDYWIPHRGPMSLGVGVGTQHSTVSLGETDNPTRVGSRSGPVRYPSGQLRAPGQTIPQFPTDPDSYIGRRRVATTSTTRGTRVRRSVQLFSDGEFLSDPSANSTTLRSLPRDPSSPTPLRHRVPLPPKCLLGRTSDSPS